VNEPLDAILPRLRGPTRVLFHREIVADHVTPVSAYASLVGAGHGYLLESVVGGARWARYSFVGLDPDVVVRARGSRVQILRGDATEEREAARPFDLLRALVDETPTLADPSLPRFSGGAVGYVAYDAIRHFEPKALSPMDRRGEGEWDFCMAIGGPVVAFDDLRKTAIVMVPAILDPAVHPEREHARALARIDAIVASLRTPKPLAELAPPGRPDHTAPLPPSSFDRPSFEAAVRVAQDHIRAGDAFQIVLSQRFRLATAGRDLFSAYRRLRALNPSPYMYFLDLPGVRIAGASPETLVRVETAPSGDRTVEVRPIAGTRRRGASDLEDERIAEELLADPKERAEHVMLVDLGRNDLGRVSKPGTVRVTEQMGVERYSHVMHLVSKVIGELRDDVHALDVLAATFPAGTLSGAPKVRAMQIIDALEPEARGIYGGAVGYLGWDGNLDVAIAIRTLVEIAGEIRVQAGAGVVEASDPGSEYDETVNKARAAITAIDG
jgi:anthranilate synthase component 1